VAQEILGGCAIEDPGRGPLAPARTKDVPIVVHRYDLLALDLQKVVSAPSPGAVQCADSPIRAYLFGTYSFARADRLDRPVAAMEEAALFVGSWRPR
jgi:hypothetical protein